MKKGTPVVVTTDSTKRGVFGGLFVSEKSDVVVLSEARMAVYWDKETRGVVGLASTGPTAGCRISPPAINVHLALLKMEAAGNTQGLKKKISNAQRLLQKSVKIVHRFARELRPTLLDDIGIIPAFRVYIKDFTKHTRIPVHFDCVGSVEQVNPARRTALYRVAQEALGNVAQHAQASRVTMNLRKVRNAVRMTIKDNGKSFQVERVILGHKNRSLGLLGMRERIEMVGGNFKIDSVRGKGTTVQARVPLK